MIDELRLSLPRLGRHEARRSHDCSRGRERRCLAQASHAEIQEAHAAAVEKENVRWLQISMQNPGAVSNFQRFNDGIENLDDARKLETLVALLDPIEILVQVYATQQLHH